jgi:O-methyltransferase domain
VGGGQGGFLAEVLARAPATEGILFDLPEVAAAPTTLAAAGLPNRWQSVAGDFFERVPAGADGYMLKRILHDWSDQGCERILRSCRAAMGADARLLVVDAIVPSDNTPHPAKIMDILMLTLTAGRERTQAEFEQLFEHADLRLVRVVPTHSTLSLLEAMPM